jgi:hypothetical protein
MNIKFLTEFLDAAHLSRYVDHKRPQRGGIILVGPPGALKSTVIKSALNPYPQALVLSDLNMNTLTKMKEDMVSGRYCTLAFEEMQKLYERNASTASNIEGAIKAFVDQGFLHPSFSDQRMVGLEARMLVIGAMTYNFYSTNYTRWTESGFARRFLWMFYRTSSYNVIGDAIEQNRDIMMDDIPRKWPNDRQIPYNISVDEAKWLRSILRYQVDDLTCQILMQKIFCVLKWKYNDAKKAREVISSIEPLISKTGGEIELTLKERRIEKSGKPHSPKKTGRSVSRGRLRSDSKPSRRTEVSEPEIRLHGLESERGLSTVSERSMDDNAPEKTKSVGNGTD